MLPELAGATGSTVTLGGVAPEDRDFVHAVYGKFPYVLAFVILLTFVLLMRAFRSVLLPIKAVVLNLVSLGAAFGIIVFIFQQGHGSETIWGVHATGAIISWIPLMIFAFLYGLSMDYEVFMVTRMREAYDETHDTRQAVALGLARTGKLVTSAALVLMFAFFVLSTGPGVDIKQFGIGLAAGIIFDATVIRALLVPAIMRIAGDWNWWFPKPVQKALFLGGPQPERARARRALRRPGSRRGAGRLRAAASSPSAAALRRSGASGPARRARRQRRRPGRGCDARRARTAGSPRARAAPGSTPSPPRWRPAPPEPSRSAYRSTRSG